MAGSSAAGARALVGADLGQRSQAAATRADRQELAVGGGRRALVTGGGERASEPDGAVEPAREPLQREAVGVGRLGRAAELEQQIAEQLRRRQRRARGDRWLGGGALELDGLAEERDRLGVVARRVADPGLEVEAQDLDLAREHRLAGG